MRATAILLAASLVWAGGDAALAQSGALPFEDPAAYGGPLESDTGSDETFDEVVYAEEEPDALEEAAPMAVEPRVALIVGVSNYAAAAPLANPANDAQLIANTLIDLGFDVTLELDPSLRDLQEAVIGLKLSMMAAGPDAIGLFYFAGHGIQHNGVNYLVPADAGLRDAEYLDVEAVSANWVLGVMQSAGVAANFLVLDACRNDPFTRAWRSATRAHDTLGLAQMQPPRGSFVVFSTAPGAVAYDGEGANSPFAEALVNEIREPGVLAETMFRYVVDEVEQMTEYLQSPWVQFSFSGDFFFGGPPRQEDAPAGLVSVNALEAMYWSEVDGSGDASLLQQYLGWFPEGAFADEANAQLAALAQTSDAPEPESDPLTVSAAELIAAPAEYEGPCPASVGFSGTIRTAGGPAGEPGLVSYSFLNSEGEVSPVQTVSLNADGTAEVSHAWTVGEDENDRAGWMMLEVREPDFVRSERASFSVTCVQPETRAVDETSEPGDETARAPIEVPRRMVWRARRNPDFLAQVEQDDPALAAEIRRLIAEADAAALALGPPTLIAPADGALFSVTPRTTHFAWEPVEGARAYRLEIDCFGCCAPGAWCSEVGGQTFVRQRIREPRFSHVFVGAQPGRWRVQARLRGGAETPVSEWREFTHTQ